MLAHLGAAVGCAPHMPIGDDWNHAGLFMMHVGLSSRGSKDTAKKLIFRINNAVKAKDEYLVSQAHCGALSTCEGLSLMIHDAGACTRTRFGHSQHLRWPIFISTVNG